MRKLNSIVLESSSIREILKFSAQKTYTADSHLYYEGQVPIIAVLLIDGCIQLFKKKKTKKIILSGSLIGFAELMTNTPSATAAMITANSTVCFLDKSAIKEILQTKNSFLAQLITQSGP